jgi:ppGpp synthetase/RelA/SpoT-type nucleotidyltranferase
MALPRWIDDVYGRHRPYFEALEGYAQSVLSSFCRKHGYQLTHRVKSPISVAEKLESGRFRSWWEVEDFVGLTVVIPNLTHEEMVLRHLGSVFSEIRVEGRQRSERDPRVFQFDSTKWYGRVRIDPPPSDLPAEALPITFEVQVQTVLEFAWSIATHDTTYKGPLADWSQRRLAASVKASVEQLDLMIANFMQTAETIPPAPHPELDAKAKVISIFQELIADKAIDASLQPESWLRFADNVWRLVRTASPLADAEAATKVVDFCSQLATAIRQGTFPPGMSSTPVSGSLFQLVLAWAHTFDPRMLEAFSVIPSAELPEIYGLPEPPRSITEVAPHYPTDE